MKRLSVIIVTYNSADTLGAVLRAVRAETPIDPEICCVDNASWDQTADIIRSFPNVRCIRLEANTGFSAGCNRGVRETDGEWVLFLNPDAAPLPGSIAKMVGALEFSPSDVAGVGPKLIRSKKTPSGGSILDSTGILLNRAAISPCDRGQGEADRGQYDRDESFLGPSAACALFRRGALADLALDGEIFDEDFFAYYEDVDLAWRARVFGYRFLFVPGAVVVHDRKNPQSYSAAARGMAFVNRYFCAIKNDPRLGDYLLNPAAYESMRFFYKMLTVPGFSAAAPHFFNCAGRMIEKRALVQARRAVDRSTLRALP